MIIDANALIHRAYHAVPPTIKDSEGRVSNAVYGFINMIIGLLTEEKPVFIASAFDHKGPTFRDELYSEYKSTRVKTDDFLIQQFPRIRELLEAFGLGIYEEEGLEADDFLGLVSVEVLRMRPNTEILVVTGDKDAFQLVNDCVTVGTPVSGAVFLKKYSATDVKEKMGVWPDQIPDYKALAGDSSDHILGVPGVGAKTAVSLLSKFPTLDEIYKNLDKVESPRIRELLRTHEADARLCLVLATIAKDMPVKVNLHDLKVSSLNPKQAITLMRKWGFKTPVARMEKLFQIKAPTPTPSEGQASLF